MLFAARDGPGLQHPIGDLPTLRLAGLKLGECELLARRRGLTVPPERPRFRRPGDGRQPARRPGDHHACPVADGRGEQDVTVGLSAQRAWRSVLHRLPVPTRRALFVVAVSHARELPALPVILDTVQLGLDDLDRRGAGPGAGGHRPGDAAAPAAASRTVDSTPLAVRLRTYRALADLAEPDLRAWYLSHATVGPVREIADRLVEAAEDTRRRSGYSAALRLSKRAAELTADGVKRADRLLAAATDAQLAGDARSAADWCQEALDLRTDPPFTAAATLLRGRALTWVGEPGHGYEALIRAAADTRSQNPHLAAELSAEAIMPAVMIGDVHAAVDAAVACQAECAAGVTPSFRMLVHGRGVLCDSRSDQGGQSPARRRRGHARRRRPGGRPAGTGSPRPGQILDGELRGRPSPRQCCDRCRPSAWRARDPRHRARRPQRTGPLDRTVVGRLFRRLRVVAMG